MSRLSSACRCHGRALAAYATRLVAVSAGCLPPRLPGREKCLVTRFERTAGSDPVDLRPLQHSRLLSGGDVVT